MKTPPDRHRSETTPRLRHAPRHAALLILGLTMALSTHPSKGIPICDGTPADCTTYEDPRIRIEISKIELTSDSVILNYRLRKLNSGTPASYFIYAALSEDLKVWTLVRDSLVEGFLSDTPASVLQGSVTFEKPAGKQMFFRLYAEASLVGG